MRRVPISVPEITAVRSGLNMVSATIVDDPLAGLPADANLRFTATFFWPKTAPLGERAITNGEALGGCLLHVGVLRNREQLFVHGSAVLVAPGIAIAAKHVIQDYQGDNVAVYCGSITSTSYELWQCTRVEFIDNSDLAILILKYVTALPPGNNFRIAGLTVRLPTEGERVAIVGFSAADDVIPLSEGAAVRGEFRLSVGTVTEQYPEGRDRSSLPGPCFEVDSFTAGGMSGGPVFDHTGRVVGILSKCLPPDGPSYVSLLWPALLVPIHGEWPKQAHTPRLALCDPGARCSIDYKGRLKRVGDSVGRYTDLN
jgi:hypothetical protein